MYIVIARGSYRAILKLLYVMETAPTDCVWKYSSI